MNHRGPFQPLTFYDSVILSKQTCQKGYITQSKRKLQQRPNMQISVPYTFLFDSFWQLQPAPLSLVLLEETGCAVFLSVSESLL